MPHITGAPKNRRAAARLCAHLFKRCISPFNKSSLFSIFLLISEFFLQRDKTLTFRQNPTPLCAVPGASQHPRAPSSQRRKHQNDMFDFTFSVLSLINLNEMNQRWGGAVHALIFTSQRKYIRSEVGACSPFPSTASQGQGEWLNKPSRHKGLHCIRGAV